MVYTTHKNGDEWGMVYYCYTNIRCLDLEAIQIRYSSSYVMYICNYMYTHMYRHGYRCVNDFVTLGDAHQAILIPGGAQ